MADKITESTKRTILITGCSDGGLGAALAIAFHEAGLHVYATARNASKMTHLASLGIETLTLDVLSDESIATCVSQVPKLDILVNNAGASAHSAISDLSIPDAKKLFDLNVWSYLAVTQAFLPLLLKSKGIIVNQTSVTAVNAMPFQAAYNASKTAISMFSNTLRLELQPFDVTVLDLKTGAVKSNLIKNRREVEEAHVLPEGSIYEPARDIIEKASRSESMDAASMPSDQWAQHIVQEVLKKKPKPVIWSGNRAWLAWFGSIMPFGMLDATSKKMTGLDLVEQRLRK